MEGALVLDFDKALRNAHALKRVLDDFDTQEEFVKCLQKHKKMILNFMTGECIADDGEWHWEDDIRSKKSGLLRIPLYNLLYLFGVDYTAIVISDIHPAVEYLPEIYMTAACIFELNGISVRMLDVVLKKEVVDSISSSIREKVKQANQSKISEGE